MDEFLAATLLGLGPLGQKCTCVGADTLHSALRTGLTYLSAFFLPPSLGLAAAKHKNYGWQAVRNGMALIIDEAEQLSQFLAT